ncbi:uncharacterized protein Z519_03828 [Cladophialophora bantiana CBS 173.52]|uniref:DUF3824 domain-containing protein n=1 Tax=Cladophialophora bantiana (strain ATCC 10958 / CBS 173.52 / CDC B-1940 / NIH 8579) TaxID=1442370 RepID=A0A0D2IEM7_CLAB1|nr:uncharacterized protein Z519_03828 [Cladophialophora bantiana CBS 173.52]KIW95244.1 hypothetical protein Z519_03828 [Cladophialophora bantiana CBS 173.52]
MSYYDDDRPRRQKSTRERSRRDDYEDTVYDNNTRDTRIVKRRDDSVDSIEEVSRDFAPGDRGTIYRETTVRKSGHRPMRARSSDDRYYDDRYDDRSYVSRKKYEDDYVVVDNPKGRSRDYDDRRRSRRYSSDYESRSRSRTPPKKERRKSTAEELLGSVGLGGVAGALLGKSKSRDRSRSSSRDGRHRSRSRAGRRSSSDRSRHRSKSRGKVRNEQISQAIKAAVLAGAGEAFRARKVEGGWGGEKGKRIITAALAAGGVDGLISNKDDPHHHSKRDILGSAIAGMATNRIINGPRSKSRGRNGSPDSRRGRSQSRGGLGDLAAGGVVAATAKKVYDSVRSRSRGRARSRSASSYDSRSPSPRRKRSRSVSAFAAKGLAALGLKDAADKVDPNRERDRRRNYDDYYDDGRSSRNGGYGYSDSRDVGTIQPQFDYPDGGPRSMSVPRGPPPGYELDYGPRHTGDPETDSDSDLGSSSEDEKEIKKGRKKMWITGGLATVATIHAAHSVYQSMEKRETRKKLLKQGDITEDQARRSKNKNRLQDAASIGIAALGLKGAYSEWQEMHEQQKEVKEEKEKRERHRLKREARRRKMSMIAAHNYADSGFTGSMPNLATYSQQYPAFPPPPGASFGPDAAVHYTDDNPYGAVTHPPPAFVPTPPPSHMGVPRAETG